MYIPQAGEIVGTLICTNTHTNETFTILSLSGTEDEVNAINLKIRDSLPKNQILAPAKIDIHFWAGHKDVRFISGKNDDGSLYLGDSTTCPEPRLYQCAQKLGFKSTSMALLWRGEGTNPFPVQRNKTGERFMNSCPSCLANEQWIVGKSM